MLQHRIGHQVTVRMDTHEFECRVIDTRFIHSKGEIAYLVYPLEKQNPHWYGVATQKPTDPEGILSCSMGMYCRSDSISENEDTARRLFGF